VVLSDCAPLSLAGEGGPNAAQSFFRRVFSRFFINQRLVLYQRSCSVGAEKANRFGLKPGDARIEASADASSQKCSQSGDGVDHDGAVHAWGHAKIRRNGDP
jgi:hypothetical protein